MHVKWIFYRVCNFICKFRNNGIGNDAANKHFRIHLEKYLLLLDKVKSYDSKKFNTEKFSHCSKILAHYYIFSCESTRDFKM